jgi:ABC-type uncharacterized transport system substrate-binding protein
MKKKITVLSFCAMLFALCSLAQAQQPKKVHRIGYLVAGDETIESARFEGIRLALRELGYIEGQNIVTEYRYAEGKQDRYAQIAIELARLEVDVTVVAGGDPAIRAAMSAARGLRVIVQPWEVRAKDDFDKVFASQSNERPDGLYVIGGSLVRTNEKRTVGLALKGRLPSVYYNREAVDAGGLISYSADLADIYRRIAYYVDRILNGTKPADLPVEQPTKFEFVINLKTAKQIGVTISPDVLARATRIIR